MKSCKSYPPSPRCAIFSSQLRKNESWDEAADNTTTSPATCFSNKRYSFLPTSLSYPTLHSKFPQCQWDDETIKDLKEKAKFTQFKKIKLKRRNQTTSRSKLLGALYSQFIWDISQLVINRLRLFYSNSEAELSSMETLSKCTFIFIFCIFHISQNQSQVRAAHQLKLYRTSIKTNFQALKPV